MSEFVRAFRSRYGAHPLHLVVLAASFALAGFAAWSLVQNRPIAIVIWFVGAAVGHDLVILPLYALIDRGIVRGRRPTARLPRVAWANYVRIPGAMSLLLLAVFLPSIARLSGIYTTTTRLSSDSYFVHWLAITGALFLVSAVFFAWRLRRVRRQRNTTAAACESS